MSATSTLIDSVSIVTVEVAVNGILFGILFGCVLAIMSHIINLWDV